MRPGDVVVVKAFDEVPEHLFLIDEVFEGFVAGVALTGPMFTRFKANLQQGCP